MPRVDAQTRVHRYEEKRKTTMPVAYTHMVKEVKPRLENLGATADLDTTVAGVLNRHNIVSTDRIKYYNFARKIWSAKRRNVLAPALIEAEKAKYIALGCEEAVLDDIVQALTGQEAPIAP